MTCIESKAAMSFWGLKRSGVIAAALFGITAATSPAHAAPVTFSGSSGSLSASAEFSIIGGTQLQVVLTNTSKNDVLVPGDVLTAVFFNMKDTTLTPISASLGSSSVFFGPTGGGNVGGEWGYGGSLSGAPGGVTKGISSSGLGGVFGGPNFNGADLQSPLALDGLQYGITSAGDSSTTGNAAVTGNNALIKNAVTFLLSLSCSPSPCDLSKISKVSFQYGTGLNEPNIPGAENDVPINPVPLPPALLLFGTALMGLTVLGRRRRYA